jgi:hypothetical protein
MVLYKPVLTDGSKWRQIVAAASVLAVLVVTAASVLWLRTDRITEENFGRINPGMSRAEVEGVLGPAGDNSTQTLRFAGPTSRFFSGQPILAGALVPGFRCNGRDVVQWRNDSGILTVYFDQAGRVEIKAFYHIERVEQGPFNKLLRRVKRLWREWFSS